jgi:hypothetical protein
MDMNQIAAMQAELAKLKAENDALKNSRYSLKIKAGEKGTIAVYGLGRFPTSLYPEQWLALLGQADQIREFAKTHADELKAKQLSRAVAVKPTV